MTGDTLFDHPARGLARTTDPTTSQDAAKQITGRTEQMILALFKAKRQAYPSLGDHGMTDDELCGWMPTVYPPTLKSARSRLTNKRLLEDSGQRRLSQRGVEMIVWRVKDVS